MIMNHTSGLPDSPDDFWSKPDIVGAAENIDPIADTSVQFLYSNIGASLLQPVIEKAAGKSPTDFVREKIFAPMGITDFKWNRDKAVHEGTSGGIYLSTADMRKLGKLMLQEGVYDGRMIIHQATLRMLLQKSQPFEDYGLLWWLVNPAANYPVFSAVGWGGQYVAVLPAKHLVAVRTRDPAGIDEVKLPEQKFEEFRNLISQWE
jgi:CubicO group peptidase (beta-lactamase class C family)